MLEELKNSIRNLVDWPQKGIIFRDITTLLKDKKAFSLACNLLYEHCKEQKIDKIVGIEARGFIFGAVLAYQLGIGFVPARKKGKLPSNVIREAYELEYGSDYLEMHTDAINKGEKVIIVDDLIATGGTANATAKMVEKLGASVLEMIFVIALPDLIKQENVANYNIFSLLSFDGL